MIKFVDRSGNLTVRGKLMNAQAFIKAQTGGPRWGKTVRENEILTNAETIKLKTMIDKTVTKSQTARKLFKELGGYDQDDKCIVYIILVSNEFSAMSCVFSAVETKRSEARIGFIPFKPKDTYSVRHSMFKGFLLPFPQSIVLFHELGHAVQWKTRNKWYNGQIEKGMNKEYYFEGLEMDNLKKVEWPMCMEMGVNTRRNYLDIAHQPPTIIQFQ